MPSFAKSTAVQRRLLFSMDWSPGVWCPETWSYHRACLQTNSGVKTGWLCFGEGPLAKTFNINGNGNICRQWLRERSCGCAEQTCWPGLMLAGVDTDPTPASFRLALVTTHPHSPTESCVAWGECALFVFLLRSVRYVNPIILLREKMLCNPRSASMERGHL